MSVTVLSDLFIVLLLCHLKIVDMSLPVGHLCVLQSMSQHLCIALYSLTDISLINHIVEEYLIPKF